MIEFETVAWLGDEGMKVQVPVVVICEFDGDKPLELLVEDSHGNDITDEIDQDEYDMLYEKATRNAIEYMTDAVDYFEDR